MATGNSSVSADLWYCHSCQKHVEPNLTDFCCSECESGCIEEVTESSTPEINSMPEHTMWSNNMATTFNLSDMLNPMMFGQGAGGLSSPMTQLFGEGAGTVSQPSMAGSSADHLDATMRALNSLHIDSFQTFLGQFMQGLLGNGAVFNENMVNMHIQPLLASNTGDYVWTQGGLDNIVTTLMNQLDGSGPPPAERSLIESLPVATIDQQLVDSCTQCHVCMEDFVLNEKVSRLPCKHLYHTDCIVPWLEMHGTCPICRKSVTAQSDSSNSTTHHHSNVNQQHR